MKHDLVAGRNNIDNFTDDELKEIAELFKTSSEVVLRRLLDLGKTTRQFYNLKRSQWIKRSYKPSGPMRIKQSTKVINSKGKPFISTLYRAYYEDKISLSDLAKNLGVKLKHISEIEQKVMFNS